MFLAKLQAYFLSEIQGAILGVIVGLLILIACMLYWNKSKTKPMLKGFLRTLLFLAVLGLASVYNIWHNGQRMVAFVAQYESEPKTFLANETARMAIVAAWWLPLKIAWGLLMLVGLVLVLLNRKNVKTGIAIGLILIGGLGWLIDTLAQRNAHQYQNALATESKRLA